MSIFSGWLFSAPPPSKGKGSWFLPFNRSFNDGAGKRHLIQHSAGSGKSNSIAWLAHQLIGLERAVGANPCVCPGDGQSQGSAPTFDSVIVVTDRRVLDKLIKDTFKQFARVSATIGHAERSGPPGGSSVKAKRSSSRGFRSSRSSRQKKMGWTWLKLKS